DASRRRPSARRVASARHSFLRDALPISAQQLPQIDTAHLHALRAREGEQLSRQLRTAARRIERVDSEALQLFVFLRAGLDQVEIADDRGEQIVEIVRNAAG